MTLEQAIRRDRLIAAVALGIIVALAWVQLLRVGHAMHAGADAMRGMVMAPSEPWGARDLAMGFAMWAVMMAGMMLPSAAPMVLTFATINRRRAAEGAAAPVPLALFVGGYVVVWTAFGAGAALGQGLLQRAALLSPDAMRAGPRVSGVLLVAAGLYQLTPWKWACLSRCQSPLSFVLREWRDGRRGALVMGLRHGAVCLGCCWALMALLFVAGVMNLLWVAVLTAFVLVEKVTGAGRLVGHVVGVLLLGWGGWLLVTAW